MENRHVGFLILGIAIILIFIIFLFQNALKEIVASTCTAPNHSISCPMNEGINQQTWLSLGIVGILVVLGLVLIFSKPKEKIIVKKIRQRKKKLDLSGLDKKERRVIEILEKENGTIFQAELLERLDIGKVGLTRLLDKLEAKQLIERKRRGMNNVVVLKN
ncbi:MAG: hypothetical protein KatS3mg001_027 [Candidatus Pacearchaeota archaeon]|nr:MAG: hypothetical protein KatS3mg001_027 [Candidatus Pacearchaeota archaeon]